MASIRALIPAAGKGTRANLPYPKTLYAVQDRPILLHILDCLAHWDAKPTLIASPGGVEAIRACLHAAARDAFIVIQPAPAGMGDAVLRFADSPEFSEAEHVLLVWGDVPFLRRATVAEVVRTHFSLGNDFTFATRHVERAYTFVDRDASGRVTGVVETREADLTPRPGERDIGLFVFRKEVVFELLKQELLGKWGSRTGEHGFLYVIAHLAARGYRVEGLPIASEEELISLNSLTDLEVVR